MTIVSDNRPADVLRALDGPGPVAVVDHRHPHATDLEQRLGQAPPDTWLVALTSGSSSSPRLVARTRASWQASVDAFAAATATTTGTRVLVPGPLSSTLFLHAAWHARQVGATLLTDPLDASSAWDVAHVTPRQLGAMLESAADLTGRTVVVGGAALHPGTTRLAHDRGVHVIAYYGAAELSFVAVGTDVLRPFPGAQVASRNGVLWVRSPFVCSGYLGTTAAGGPPGSLRRDPDGWATVGDRGQTPPDGSVVVQGRGDEAVQTGGATVQVADVEAVVRAAPGVTDVVAFGAPHPDLGQVVVAAVESRTATVSQLRGWARDGLDRAARPRRWWVVAALPRTAAGKIDRVATVRLVTPSNTTE